MPQLGLGLGLHKSSRIETPLQALIKSSNLYLSADKADGMSPGINSPLTNPWTDLKGTADCTLVNFAGTTADGYVTETINGKTNTFLNLDGLNSFGQFADMDVLNPTSTDDFCQMVVFRPDDVGVTRYYGIMRNADSFITAQYGLLHTSTGLVQTVLNGIGRLHGDASVSLQYVLYGRINNTRFVIRNGIEVDNVEDTSSLITRPNTQMACRSGSADGLTKLNFAKGLQGDIAFWKGPQGTLDKGKIVSLVAKAMKQKYGLGV
jgi:hypothetical protein